MYCRPDHDHGFNNLVDDNDDDHEDDDHDEFDLDS